MVDQRGRGGRQILRVEQVGDQAVPLARPRAVRVVVGILDDPHHQAIGITAAIPRAGVQLRQRRTIRQPMKGLQDGVALDPRQQVGTRWHTARINS